MAAAGPAHLCPSQQMVFEVALFVILAAGTQGLGTPEPAGRAPQHQGPYVGETFLKRRCLCGGFPKCTF